MNVLVTGGAGFIGSHLIDLLLRKGHKVTCVDNLYLGSKQNIKHLIKNKNFSFSEFDVLDLTKLKRIFSRKKFNTVFHLVANSDIKKSTKNTKLDLELNFLTTYNMLEAMRCYDVKNIIFASTSAIYGETQKIIKEDMGPLQPISLYGASKLSAEAYISTYVNNYNMKAWICRFPNVVGERSTHGILYDLIHKLKKNNKILPVLGNGLQEKPYVYVKELVEGIYTVWTKSKENFNTYNLGGKSTIKVKKIVDILIEELDLKGITKVKYSGGDRGWVGDVPKFNYSINKIKSLGWKPKLNSEQAIRLSVKNLKNEYGL